jgi:hypothetical protein
MPALINRHADALQRSALHLTKELSIEGKTEQTVLKQVDWTKELALFKAIDLNKPVYRDLYNVQKSPDGKQHRYTALKHQLPVQSLLIVWDSAGQEVERIEVEYTEQNTLYSIERSLRLEIKNGQITRYRITGKQTMFMSKASDYTIVASVITEPVKPLN